MVREHKELMRLVRTVAAQDVGLAPVLQEVNCIIAMQGGDKRLLFLLITC